MNRSPEINELAAALAQAQGVMEGAKKDSDNPFFKSKYADLASTWEACRVALSTFGLSVVQAPEDCDGNGIRVTTTLLHSSGQWMESTYTVPVSKDDAQGHGSAITYARRYALAAMVGVAPEDDDGNGAVDRMPDCAQPGCTARARYVHLGKNYCGTHRPDREPAAPKNPENGKAANAAKMGQAEGAAKANQQQRFMTALRSLVEGHGWDSINLEDGERGADKRKQVIAEALGVPEPWASFDVRNLTSKQWEQVADKLFAMVEETA